MKKILITLTLLCVALTLHALDYRQVIFGNAYENIIEIDADDFFEQYPEVKEYKSNFRVVEGNGQGMERMFPEHIQYYKVYEQVIGDKKFYRVIITYEERNDYQLWKTPINNYDFLNWQEVFFTQYVFYKKPNGTLLQLGHSLPYGTYYSSTGDKLYQGIEIIERNEQVHGVLFFELRDKEVNTLSHSGVRQYLNTAEFCAWRELYQDNQALTNAIDYIAWYESYLLEAQNIGSVSIKSWPNEQNKPYSHAVLVDTKRPFMYTIQNAFDGNPKTSFVEDSPDNLFYISFDINNKFVDSKVQRFKLINGYASGDFYKANNQIAEIDVYTLFKYNRNDMRVILLDTPKMQEYKIHENNNGYFGIGVKDVVSGTKYNDTALAELDIYIDGEGWLFGGL